MTRVIASDFLQRGDMEKADEHSLGQDSRKDKERSTEKVEEEVKATSENAVKEAEGSHPWQAVWDPTRQAWYFWNSKTQETTWENPLEKTESSSNDKETQTEDSAKTAEATTSAAAAADAATTVLTDEEVAEASGIDPDLAYLDPVLFASEIRQARLGKSTYTASGAFDSRTGKFVPLSATGVKGTHDPSRLSHANQADRQMSAFFDIQQYEQERKRSRDEKEQEEAEGVSRKRLPTKKELQRYKEKAKEKKAAKYAWLRE